MCATRPATACEARGTITPSITTLHSYPSLNVKVREGVSFQNISTRFRNHLRMPPPRGLPRPAPIQIVPPRSRRPSTASAKARHVMEVGELGDDIDCFETMRGLTIAAEGLPEWDDEVASSRKSWAERKDQVEHELRMEALAERFKKGAPKPNRGTQHDLDPCHRRPVPVRPQSAPSRPLGTMDMAASRRSANMLQHYIDMHRESAEQHKMAIEDALREKIRVHEERTQVRRT